MTTEVWIAERTVIAPENSEDAAMGYERYGRTSTHDEAREALLEGIYQGVLAWRRMRFTYDGPEGEAFLKLEAHPELDSVDADGVRFQVRRIK